MNFGILDTIEIFGKIPQKVYISEKPKRVLEGRGAYGGGWKCWDYSE
jgi:hypothetical protein